MIYQKINREEAIFSLFYGIRLLFFVFSCASLVLLEVIYEARYKFQSQMRITLPLAVADDTSGKTISERITVFRLS
jgi:hypothetical protein